MGDIPDWARLSPSSAVIVILTAMDVEYQPIRKFLSGVEDFLHPAGARFTVGTLTGTRIRVALAVTGQGNGAAGQVTQQAIASFQPAALLYVGIAGALHKNLTLGEVVACDKVYAIHGGREDPEGRKHRPQAWNTPPVLLHASREVVHEASWAAARSSGSTAEPPRAQVGTIASGEVVLNSSTATLAGTLETVFGDAMAIDTESAGFAQACFMNGAIGVSVRGISDHANGIKAETDAGGWRVVAAENAAAFAVALIRKLAVSMTPNPTAQAFELAILRAVGQYATSNSALGLARPWLDRDGLRGDPLVRAQFALAVQGVHRADPHLISQRWHDAVEEVPPERDLVQETRVLLGYFQDQAHLMPSFGLATIDVPANELELTHLHHELAGIRVDLQGIAALELKAGMHSAPERLRMHRYDQTALIAESTRGFVGRRFMFENLTGHIERNSRGYCHVVAHAGVGKTALLSQLVKDHQYVHHFNVRTAGITSANTFLRNVCAQLISAYDLPIGELPPRAGENNAYLLELLARAADEAKGLKVVVVIDALDEADSTQLLPGSNPLYLPDFLPERCFIVLTTRPDNLDAPLAMPKLSVKCEQFLVPIEACGEANMADVREFIGVRAPWPGIQAYCRRHQLDGAEFIEHLAAKSEGNFMYLHHVLPDIESGNLTDRDLAGIPTGLAQYYRTQLARMRGTDDASWYDFRLPVIASLSLFRRPMTIDQIAALTGIRSKPRIADALERWAPFLQTTVVQVAGTSHRAYRIYHAGFEDFLRKHTSEVSEYEGVLIDRVGQAMSERQLS